jgi:hypothetical protein
MSNHPNLQSLLKYVPVTTAKKVTRKYYEKR